jgi:hypothetical protein
MTEVTIDEAIKRTREGIENLKDGNLDLLKDLDEAIELSPDTETKINRLYEKRIMINLSFMTDVINDQLSMLKAFHTMINDLQEEDK